MNRLNSVGKVLPRIFFSLAVNKSSEQVMISTDEQLVNKAVCYSGAERRIIFSDVRLIESPRGRFFDQQCRAAI